MFDDNHHDNMDEMIRSLLENGQEEVPPHVWDGISKGLDKAARRRNVVVWLGRAGVAVAAAAAVAVFAILNVRHDDTLVPVAEDSDMIAVVEKVQPVSEEQKKADPETGLTAYVINHPAKTPAQEIYVHSAIPSADDDNTDPETAGTENATTVENVTASVAETTSEEAEPMVQPVQNDNMESGRWEEDEDDAEMKGRKVKASLVLSGIAGTNNPQNRVSSGIRKSPAMEKSYTRTTVEQMGKETTYGIPVSFGVGAKIYFAPRWSVGIGVNYSLLSSQFNGKYIKVEDGIESLPVQGKIRNWQHYIGIPVNVYYNIVNKDFVNFYAYAGGAVEKCVQNRYEVMTTPVIHHSESVKGVQLSADLGIGVEFLLGKYVGIYIDPSLRYYFNTGQPKSIRTAQPLMLGFEMGLRFNL